MDEIEDYYVYYVHIMKIPEEIFWTADIHFLDRVVDNKSAYDSWHTYIMRKERERFGRKK